MNVTVKCPTCGEDVLVKINSWREYQGEHPHGGMVDFLEVDDIIEDCQCGENRDDAETEAMFDLACERYDPADEYDEVDYRD